ncbi:glycosyltransferase [Microlunatus antarcticus]|uniref:Glycosyltransferase involved in cell wall biosynthesis n=1 Tax=Microlunatus antarcticus TaxID=53388 RepID=A0A7W5JX07_9ACTN|nr:glycosyltransferase involved in cell wall biosynthesis [Microlunatus antarcticus]
MPGRVVYASFATKNLSGGVDVHLHHIALLRAAGIEAVLWLPQSGTPAWMGDVPVVAGGTLEVGADDVVLFPEAPVVPGVDPAPGARKIIFNQNHFYTYATWDGPLDAYPGWSPAPAVWAVSEEQAQVLRALNPSLPVSVVPPPVDPDVFSPAAEKSGIALLPKKRPHEARLLGRLLEQDPRVPAGSVHVLADVPRSEVARVLARSAVFVALSHTDSFGLPVAEAMMSGCLVAGYDGGGGVALFDAPGAWRVPEQRPLLLADRLADLLVRHEELAPLGAANRTWILERNGPDAVAAALLAAVAEARERPGGRSVATHPAAWLDRMPDGFTKTG